MSKIILPESSFVWCRFPFDDSYRSPGPDSHPHVVYIEEVIEDGAVSVFTTSKLPENGYVREGEILVSKESAYAMGQKKPFVINCNRIGYFPITNEWFPKLDEPNHGILGVATVKFQHKITLFINESLEKRLKFVRRYGPEAPIQKTDDPKFKP